MFEYKVYADIYETSTDKYNLNQTVSVQMNILALYQVSTLSILTL